MEIKFIKLKQKLKLFNIKTIENTVKLIKKKTNIHI